eukprot:3940409-Rhodomonas_salina.2
MPCTDVAYVLPLSTSARGTRCPALEFLPECPPNPEMFARLGTAALWSGGMLSAYAPATRCPAYHGTSERCPILGNVLP